MTLLIYMYLDVDFVFGEKICQNLHQGRKFKLYMCYDILNCKNFGKYVLQCNRPFRQWAILIGDHFT